MENTLVSREELLSGLQNMKGLIRTVLSQAQEKAQIFDRFREEQELVNAKKPKMIGAMAVITSIVLYIMFLLYDRNWLGAGAIAVFGALLFVSIKKKKKKWTALCGIVIAVFCGTYLVETIVSGSIFNLLSLIFACCLVIGTEAIVVSAINRKRRAENAAVRSNNAEVQAEYDEANRKFKEYSRQLNDYVDAIGYPPDYCSLDAVEFFINAVRNGRADDFRELLTLYIDELRFRAQQEHWNAERAQLASIKNSAQINTALLQQNNQQLRYLNVISTANMFANISNGAKLDALRNTAASNGAKLDALRNTTASFRDDYLHRRRA